MTEKKSKEERIAEARAEYYRIVDPAVAEYHRIADPAWAEYLRKCRSIEEEP